MYLYNLLFLFTPSEAKPNSNIQVPTSANNRGYKLFKYIQ